MVDAPFSPAPVPPLPATPQPPLSGGQLAAIHAALVARLQASFPPAQFTHEVVPQRMSSADWERLTRKTPMVGLGWAGMDPERPGQRVWRGQSKWIVLLANGCKTASDQVLGNNLPTPYGAPGLYGMMSLAAVTLHGRDIAGIGSAVVGAGSPVYGEDWAKSDIGMAALNVSVPFDLVDEAGLAALDDFLTNGVLWENIASIGLPAATELNTVNEG